MWIHNRDKGFLCLSLFPPSNKYRNLTLKTFMGQDSAEITADLMPGYNRAMWKRGDGRHGTALRNGKMQSYEFNFALSRPGDSPRQCAGTGSHGAVFFNFDFWRSIKFRRPDDHFADCSFCGIVGAIRRYRCLVKAQTLASKIVIWRCGPCDGKHKLPIGGAS